MTSAPPPDHALRRLATEVVARTTAAVGLAGVALIHLLDVQSKFAETPYMGWMYLGLMAACLLTAGAMLTAHVREAWLATLVLPASAAAGFILTRTVGLPQATGDIGNWMEPLGLASLFVEGSLVVLAAFALSSLAPAPARHAVARLATA
jgi:hypothetical protein